jgi:beta-galactosidase
VTHHRLGAGSAWYVATRLNNTALDEVVRAALDRAGVEPVLESFGEVEAVRRVSTDAEYVFLLNHDRHAPAKVGISGVDLLTGLEVVDELELGPAGVAVVRREHRL